MAYTPTNRPVPSDAPEDLYFNSSTLDSLVNGPAAPVVDRTGVSRKSWAQIEAEGSTPVAQLSAGSVSAASNAPATKIWQVVPAGAGGGSIGIQAFAFDERTRNLYTLHLNGAGSGNLSTVNRFLLDGPIQQSSAGSSTPLSSDVGHQGLALEELPGTDFRLWSTGYAQNNQAVRYQYTDGGALTDIQLYTLFDGTSTVSCTPAISHGQEYLLAYGTLGAVTDITVRIWRLKDLVAGGPGDYSTSYLHQFTATGLVDATHPGQGLASDGKSVWLVAGNNDINASKRLYTYSIQGKLINRDDNFTAGRAQALLDGAGTVYEPEGLALLRNATGSLSLFSAVISGDLGTRFSRILMLGGGEVVNAATFAASGNTRAVFGALTESGAAGAKVEPQDAASGLIAYGAGDSTYPSRVGFRAGAVATPVATVTRSTTHASFNSVEGDLRLNAMTGFAVRLQYGGITQAAMDGTNTIDYVPPRPLNTNSLSNGTASREWADIRSVLGTFSSGVRLGQFTLATLPSAAALSGYLIDVTNATGGPKVCRSNGTVWQILNTTTTVS